MSQPTTTSASKITPDFDVLVIGAGISGIDAAYHLTKTMPDQRFAVLDSKPDFGGTWRTHTFPGIRSDSDLYTFGFKWKPWTGVPIATAEEILAYLEEAIDENELRPHIRFGHTVERAEWDSGASVWHVTVTHSEGTQTLSCRFLWMCSGYYRHSEGYQPEWPGMADFDGPIIHPQNWPDDLDHAGRRVIVIGSGATAATLIPALAKTAAHVTMLQRSPTYYYPRPATDEFIETLRALDLPDEWEHEVLRRKFLHEQQIVARRSIEEPDAFAADLIGAAQTYLGADYDVATHFTPTYRPWRQRLAVIPDGDLFVAIRSGKASVVTDTITRFTAEGLELESGETLEADIIVTATGLVLNALGDIAFTVDGAPVDLSQSWTHRGVMLTGLPNLAMVFGYLRSSWTLRADLVSTYVCRLIAHMQERQATSVVPALRSEDIDMPARPWVDPENFNAGYILRGLDIMPKQGDRQPWVMTQDYFDDRETLPVADLEDGTLVYRQGEIRSAS
ncbi:NAD(P)/FAD-dependent oxidoreductase [Sedimentitalea sp.]|uniref:flavin-containing monooxygenase n=1 Tax=Sedimentitalea sp. TaxID=2048915 RepID=UPI003299C88D